MEADSVEVDVEQLMARLAPHERAWLDAQAREKGGLAPALGELLFDVLKHEFLYRWRLYEWRIRRGLVRLGLRRYEIDKVMVELRRARFTPEHAALIPRAIELGERTRGSRASRRGPVQSARRRGTRATEGE